MYPTQNTVPSLTAGATEHSHFPSVLKGARADTSTGEEADVQTQRCPCKHKAAPMSRRQVNECVPQRLRSCSSRSVPNPEVTQERTPQTKI